MDYHERRIRRVLAKRKILLKLKNRELAIKKGRNIRTVECCDNLSRIIIELYSGMGNASERLGLSQNSLNLFNPDFSGKKLRKTRDERVKDIEREIENGAPTVDEIAKRLGLSPMHIYQHYRGLIALPPLDKMVCEYSRSKPNLEIDRLVQQGNGFLSLEDIGKEVGVTREWIRQYLIRTGKYEDFKEKRKELGHKVTIRRKILSRILSQINTIAGQQVSEEDKWAYDKTEEFFSKRNSGYSWERVFSFLKDYDCARKNGKKTTNREFAKKYEFPMISVSVILRTIGEKPLSKPFKKKRVITPRHKKQALERTFGIPMTAPDIAYFLELHKEVVSLYFCRYSRKKEQRPQVKKCLEQFSSRENVALVTYRATSEIYEAIDDQGKGRCGLSKEETLEVLSLDERVYDYAISHRQEIEPAIISALKVLYPDKEVKRPYKDFK